jgi:hypothetical protein
VAVQQYFKLILAGIMGPIGGRLKKTILKARDRLPQPRGQNHNP